MKITLRELFLILLVVALGLGWWVDRSRLASQLSLARQESAQMVELAGVLGWFIRHCGGRVAFDQGVRLEGSVGQVEFGRSYPHTDQVQEVINRRSPLFGHFWGD